MTDEDLKFMKLALELAKKAELKDEVPVGALIVRNGEIIGRGMNTSISDHDPTSHAEILVSLPRVDGPPETQTLNQR